MSLFFFNFREGASYTVDEQGCEFPSVESAYLGAVRAVQDMWRDMLIRREDPLSCSFEVTDANGNELFCLPFSEVLEACNGRAPLRPPPAGKSAFIEAIESRRIAVRAMTDASAEVRKARANLRETIDLLAEVRKAIEP